MNSLEQVQIPEQLQESEQNQSFLDKIFSSDYALYAVEFLLLCMNIAIIIIAMKFCRRFGSAVFHFLLSFLLPFVYLIYKLFTEECDVIPKKVLAILLGVYILLVILLIYIYRKNKSKNRLNYLNNLFKEKQQQEQVNTEKTNNTAKENKQYQQYLQRKKDEAEGIIYGTITE